MKNYRTNSNDSAAKTFIEPIGMNRVNEWIDELGQVERELWEVIDVEADQIDKDRLLELHRVWTHLVNH